MDPQGSVDPRLRTDTLDVGIRVVDIKIQKDQALDQRFTIFHVRDPIAANGMWPDTLPRTLCSQSYLL